MTTKQIRLALTKHQQQAMAQRAERIVVAAYPYDHNPYLAHPVGLTCERVCSEGHAK